jgi:hypothetical protein
MQFAGITSQLEERYGSAAREVSDGHWVFEVETASTRSQVVHLILKARTENGQDISRIVANSPIGPKPPRYDLERLLRRNAELDVGAICIEDFRDDEGQTATYLTVRTSQLMRTADFAEIWEMVDIVARVADQLEREIYATDQH